MFRVYNNTNMQAKYPSQNDSSSAHAQCVDIEAFPLKVRSETLHGPLLISKNGSKNGRATTPRAVSVVLSNMRHTSVTT